jgi:hypothetical protein
MHRMSWNVKEMDVIKQVSDLSMGWCINCHRIRKLIFTIISFILNTETLAEKMNKRRN